MAAVNARMGSRTGRRTCRAWVLLVLVAPVAFALAGCLPDEEETLGGRPASCLYPGPGDKPAGGTGTTFDPYQIQVGTAYGGCAAAGVSPGPSYVFLANNASYTITQTNGFSDFELWLYDSGGAGIGSADNQGTGGDETLITIMLSPGAYRVEVHNLGPYDSEFTLEVMP